jgi:capsular exopolysaccharide synthesis family protein
LPVDQSVPELRAYLATLWRRKWYIAVVLGVVVATALFYSYRQTPMYDSFAEVLVRPVNFDPTQPSSAGGFINTGTEVRVASSSAVAEIASERIGGPIPASIAVNTVGGTESLLFRSVSPDPIAAQITAQAFADAYLEFRRNEVVADLEAASQPINERIREIDGQLQDVNRRLLEEKLTESERTALQIQFNSLLSQRGFLEERLNDLIQPENLNVGEVLQDAGYTGIPFSPNHQKTLSFAIFVGLALGVGIAFLRDRLDRHVRSREDLEERLGVPVLGMIPHFGPRFRRTRPKLVTMSDPDSGVSEAYRTLRTSLLQAAAQRGIKNVMITSAKAGEGKTLTTANLGVALAQAGKCVVIVSADLRRPAMQRYFHTPNGTGVSDVLAGRRSAVDALSWVGIDNLWVLQSGSPLANVDSVVNSRSITDMLSQLEETADFILIDSAPVLGVSDSIAMALAADAVLIVADAQRADRGAIDEARRLLDQIDANVIGAVLTNTDRHSYPYYDRYRPRTPAKPVGAPNGQGRQFPLTAVQEAPRTAERA